MAGPNKVLSGLDANVPEDQEIAFDRAGPQGDRIVSQLHGPLAEASRCGALFYAANQAAVATTVAATLTYTGLCIYNPVGNDKDIILIRCAWHLTVGQVAISEVGLMVGYNAGAGGPGLTLTTELALTGTIGPIASLYIGTQIRNPSARVSESVTFLAPGPYVCAHFGGAFTAGALGAGIDSHIDIGGAVRLAPGGYAAIYTLTATTGMGYFWWMEVPRRAGAGT